MAKKAHPVSELDAQTEAEVLVRARKMAEKESLNIRLGMLREKYGVKPSEITNFTQTTVSKLENRKDLRISTLIDYLDCLQMESAQTVNADYIITRNINDFSGSLIPAISTEDFLKLFDNARK
jgi:hypothetical protein